MAIFRPQSSNATLPILTFQAFPCQPEDPFSYSRLHFHCGRHRNIPLNKEIEFDITWSRGRSAARHSTPRPTNNRRQNTPVVGEKETRAWGFRIPFLGALVGP